MSSKNQAPVKATENKSRASFSGRMGFVLSAAGASVGLGNIWRFPYLAAKYGGGIFLLIYIILALTFGYTMIVAETVIGRRTKKSPVGAFRVYSDKKFYHAGGWMNAIIPILIVPYYSTIGGWVLHYMAQYVRGNSSLLSQDSYFGSFITNSSSVELWFIVFSVITLLIITAGVRNGIERVSKIMMPILVALSLIVTVYSVTREGALAGVIYFLIPNPKNFSWMTVVSAMGQMFYSLSIAMGILVTFGSYMKKDVKIESATEQVEIFDTGIAILAGLIIVPAVFVFSGGDASALNAGPSLMFITLPNVFGSMTGGQIVGAVFFILVALAALTSSISLMETVVSIIMEKFRLKRIPACLITVLICLLLGMLSVLGYSSWSNVKLIGMQFLDFFDFISNNIMMPVVALLTCILIGWVVKPKYVEEEVLVSQNRFRSRTLLSVMLRFVCPVCMVIILLTPFVTDI